MWTVVVIPQRGALFRIVKHSGAGNDGESPLATMRLIVGVEVQGKARRKKPLVSEFLRTTNRLVAADTGTSIHSAVIPRKLFVCIWICQPMWLSGQLIMKSSGSAVELKDNVTASVLTDGITRREPSTARLFDQRARTFTCGKMWLFYHFCITTMLRCVRRGAAAW